MRLNWINAVLAFIATFHTQVEVVDFPVQKLQHKNTFRLLGQNMMLLWESRKYDINLHYSRCLRKSWMSLVPRAPGMI